MILLYCLKVDNIYIYICILPTDMLVRYGNPDKITQMGILYYGGILDLRKFCVHGRSRNLNFLYYGSSRYLDFQFSILISQLTARVK